LAYSVIAFDSVSSLRRRVAWAVSVHSTLGGRPMLNESAKSKQSETTLGQYAPTNIYAVTAEPWLFCAR